MATYVFILSLSRFCTSVIGLVVHGGEEYRAMAEMKQDRQLCSCMVFDNEFASRSSVE